jgi:hypothetical protein
VVIESYTGDGGKVVIPAKIEGLPVVELGRNAFFGEYNGRQGPGYNITSVLIPASVKFIDYDCFSRIEKLESVTFLGSGVEISEDVFFVCVNLSELKFPGNDNALIPETCSGSILTSAFRGCKKLPLEIQSKLKAMGFDEA